MARNSNKRRDVPDDHRVWIELEVSATPEANHKRAELANNMLSRLIGKKVKPFWYNDNLSCYCYGEVEYTTLSDNGQWFDLEVVGEPYEPAK